MIQNLPNFLSWAQGKSIAVVGAGISNRPLIELLLQAGLEVTVFDRSTEELLAPWKESLLARNLRANWSLGPAYLDRLHGFDLIFRTPIVRPDLAALEAERKRGAIISSEMEVFLQLCPCEVIGITGSDGKTTTSTLTALALETAGYRTWLGGNIGAPLLSSLPEMRASDKVVVELSSFQLMSMATSPHTAVITNLSPNHLDVHKDFQEYAEAKAQIFSHQAPTDRLVLLGSDPVLQDFALRARGQVIWTEVRPFGDQVVFGLDHDLLYYQASPQAEQEKLLERQAISLPGRFNALNVLSALAATDHLLNSKQKLQVREALASFKGVDHRLQEIRVLEGVRYYDSSIDSSPARTIASLSAFRERGIPLYLIAGGKDKNLQYEELGRAILASCRQVYLCGQNADLIAQAVEAAQKAQAGFNDQLKVQILPSYAACLAAARQEAKAGSAVLLSPAGTSFDRFKNFEERGQLFQKLVAELR
ncbi:MAG: UDP-N-acetylmuramoyl-L-alanine--D-glutamate ligase [Eubacteriales bacterium]|nr:UDP-N-acetylmuramoyl-L-alanine--D-glutamate ligase [Eubacteriales bacterium]